MSGVKVADLVATASRRQPLLQHSPNGSKIARNTNAAIGPTGNHPIAPDTNVGNTTR